MKNLLLITNPWESSYSRLFITSYQQHFDRINVAINKYNSWSEVVDDCKSKNINMIATTTFPFFKFLEGTQETNYGYDFVRDGIHVVLLPSIKRLFTEPQMPYYISMLLGKLHSPDQFITPTTFTFEVLEDEADLDRWVQIGNLALCKSIDIETGPKEFLVITSVAYTFAVYSKGMIRTHSIVLDFHKDPMRKLKMMRRLNATKSPAIMQNGQYDACYFLRFNAPVYAWLFDTYNMHNCLYPEFDKDLSFLARTYLHGVAHWKEMAGYNKLEYNARDTHNTLWAWLGILWHIKCTRATYAIINYHIQFPKVFPALHCAMEGILVDVEKMNKLYTEKIEQHERLCDRLNFLFGATKFNPGSSQQVIKLMKGLEFQPSLNVKTKKESSDTKELQRWAEAHPLYEHLVTMLRQARLAKKAASTYFAQELIGNRTLYHIDPAGTDSGRMASKKSNFWCGGQVQNQPGYAKVMYMADEGFHLAEIDKKQSESFCTGYLSQDTNLLHVLHTSKDFHCSNAELFFGIPFDELFSVAEMKVLRKDIRTVAKRVNHGANYNMGAFVLWTTMGTKAVFEAARLLKLPRNYTPMRICDYLLSCFDKAYPRIKGKWYAEVIDEVRTTGKLVGPTGWTRRTFLQPMKGGKPNKLAINSIVAHHPQSLSAMLVNDAFFEAWKLQITKYPRDMRMKATIHDSLFFQYRIGHEHIVSEVQQIMDKQVVTVHGRVMQIGTDVNMGVTTWGAMK